MGARVAGVPSGRDARRRESPPFPSSRTPLLRPAISCMRSPRDRRSPSGSAPCVYCCRRPLHSRPRVPSAHLQPAPLLSGHSAPTRSRCRRSSARRLTPPPLRRPQNSSLAACARTALQVPPQQRSWRGSEQWRSRPQHPRPRRQSCCASSLASRLLILSPARLLQRESRCESLGEGAGALVLRACCNMRALFSPPHAAPSTLRFRSSS